MYTLPKTNTGGVMLGGRHSHNQYVLVGQDFRVLISSGVCGLAPSISLNSP